MDYGAVTVLYKEIYGQNIKKDCQEVIMPIKLPLSDVESLERKSFWLVTSYISC